MGDIVVLAGPNGGGKSSVGGRQLLDQGGRYFNPDVVARQLSDEQPDVPLAELNSRVWSHMRDQLKTSIVEGTNFAFESTLGGSSITGLLKDGARAGSRVRVWFVALADAEMHIERVRARAAGGGHAIPEDKIRERYDSSREHVRQLLSIAYEVRVFDNSETVDTASGVRATPKLLVHVRESQLVYCCPAAQVPQWAQDIIQEAESLTL